MIQINAELLRDAKFETSKNETISLTMLMLKEYNSGVVADADKPGYLERLLQCLGEWITSHQPTRTTTNVARWDAMESLAQAITDEAEGLEVRLLSGPANWKKVGELKNPHLGAKAKAVHRSYWLEYLDPHHRPGFFLSSKFKEWREAPQNAAKRVSFWDFVRTATERKVEYFRDAAIRSGALIELRGSVMHVAHDNSKFDTRLHNTVESGTGWAIFVVSPDGEMYAGDHVEGEFHHSSFLAGGPVMAAGELAVADGELRAITAKSGHYTPSRRNMHTLVNRLVTLRGDAIIFPDFIRKPTPAYRVSGFRRDFSGGTPVSQGQVMAELPDWAKNAKSGEWLGDVA